jgi:hypothetical protein
MSALDENLDLGDDPGDNLGRRYLWLIIPEHVSKVGLSCRMPNDELFKFILF